MMDFTPFIPFEKSHIDSMEMNEFSPVDRVPGILDDEEYKKYTLIDGGPVLVFCFRNYFGDNYEAFILASTSMRLRHGAILREVIDRNAKSVGAKRIHTVSVACDRLDKWHEYLGFTCEGTHKMLMFNKDYRTWAKVWV